MGNSQSKSSGKSKGSSSHRHRSSTQNLEPPVEEEEQTYDPADYSNRGWRPGTQVSNWEPVNYSGPPRTSPTSAAGSSGYPQGTTVSAWAPSYTRDMPFGYSPQHQTTTATPPTTGGGYTYDASGGQGDQSQGQNQPQGDRPHRSSRKKGKKHKSRK
ncbi:hypothetical protein B0T25DRAFT_568925 [Lasiosphaeria hispida]|uniref:Uncharacterized protein n=1 Tax=Lasiosphaeria hispida TaxID=260671 RepID=A0AAJ0MES3_9PEZI|nr:hypothetical protein B0T25DRAFT_568925 [Lasiosphaeria hispida]